MTNRALSLGPSTDPASVRRHDDWHRLVAPPTAASTALCLGGSALMIVSAAIHLHLWAGGYRHIPTIGPLFVLQGVVGALLALMVSVIRRPVAALTGAIFMASTFGGLVLSVEIGLFGFKDSLDAPFARWSLAVESAAFVLLMTAALVGIRGSGGNGHTDRRRGRSRPT
ncbi:MAG: hypothetical protein ABSC90_09440 [Acidimicrobiales bacterium]|jgi:hypothetical protein